jgi:hypothetical protein
MSLWIISILTGLVRTRLDDIVVILEYGICTTIVLLDSVYITKLDYVVRRRNAKILSDGFEVPQL